METEDQRARAEGTGGPGLGSTPHGSTFTGLCESSGPWPFRVGPRAVLLLDGLLRQARLLEVGGSAERGEGVAVDMADRGEEARECSERGLTPPWRPGWMLLTFSDDLR